MTTLNYEGAYCQVDDAGNGLFAYLPCGVHRVITRPPVRQTAPRSRQTPLKRTQIFGKHGAWGHLKERFNHYQSVPVAQFHLYMAEGAWLYNTRKNADRKTQLRLALLL